MLSEISTVASNLAYKVAADATVVLADDSNPWKAEPCMPPGFGKVVQMFGMAKWVSLVVCVFALVGYFARLAMERQSGGGSGSTGWLGKILISIVGISAVGTFIGFFFGSATVC
jgi:hypothetical protein